MTSRDFVIWMRGFSEACHDFHPTPKQWDRLKEVLSEVEDYNDYGDLEEEVHDWYGTGQEFKIPLSGSLSSASLTYTSGSSTTNISATVWNDKMGAWHYTNYPEGFGYYDNKENKKQQLND